MTLAHRPDAVVFDMDGVLFDTEAILQDAIAAAGPQLGFDFPRPLFLSMLGLSGDASRARLLEHYGPTFDVEAFWAAVGAHYHRLLHDRQFLKAGVIELLDWLDAQRIPRAIATSSQHVHVQRNLAKHDLTGRFDVIVAHGDCELGKPDPAPFLKAAERLRVDPQRCLALEDSFNGVRAASAAGMMTIMVPDLLEPTDDVRALCVTVAPDLHRVREILTHCHF